MNRLETEVMQLARLGFLRLSSRLRSTAAAAAAADAFSGGGSCAGVSGCLCVVGIILYVCASVYG